MKRKINYILVLILMLFVGNIMIYAETSGTGGIGGGASTGGSDKGSWDSEKYGFYIAVYNSNNIQKGTTYSQDVAIEGLDSWIHRTGDTSFKSSPEKLYQYLNIPYSGYKGTYDKLLSIIKDKNIPLSNGDYILIEPYAYISNQPITFRGIVSTTNIKVQNWVYYKYYKVTAILLANAAKVGETITVGGHTYTAPSKICDEAYYNSGQRCGWPTNSYIGYGITVLKYDDIYKVINKKGKLTIQKKNKSGSLIYRDAKFNLYAGPDCSNFNQEITVNGSKTLELDAGEYSIEEIQAPAKYKKDDECYNVTIKAGQTLPFPITNESTCESEFDELSEWQKTDIQTRLNLFHKYINRSEGTPYQLLNFTNTTNPCSATRDCGIVYNSTCTNTTIRYDGFNSNNLSCYSTIENVDNKKAYCVYEYNYDSTFLNVYNKNSFINAGRIIFQDLDNLGLGYLQKRCYSYDGSANYSGGFNYTDYIDSVSILNQKLDYDVSGIESFNNDKEYIGKRNIKYSKINYIEKVSGLSSDRYCIDGECIRVSGIVTRFETDINDGDSFNIDFTPEVRLAGTYLDFLRKDAPDLSNKVNQSDYCMYTFDKQMIKDNKPNLEFRIIDTRNPFPGKTGSGRIIGSNWCDSDGTCTSVGIEDYSNLITIQENIINRVNSNGINGNGEKVAPKYIINLNYNSIKDIREYNNNHDYSNFSQICDSEQKCGSRFLSDIKNKNYMITTN